MKRYLYLAALLAFFLLVFTCGKLAFMLYNSEIEPFAWSHYCDVVRHGLSMDVSSVCYLLIVPWLASLVAVWWKKMPVRSILRWYLWTAAVLVVICIATDCVMYAFWKFKLNAVIFAYATSATEAGNSVTYWFLISRIIAVLLSIVLVGCCSVKLTPRRLVSTYRWRDTLLMLLVGVFILLGIRGGTGVSNMNVGQAYYSQTLFFNHAAVNPAFSLMSSIKRTDRFADNFNYFDEEECAQTFSGLFPAETEDICDTLLRIQRPNILFVLMESFGGCFVEELGGVPGVTPEISRLIPEGIFWDNYYSNSFRTDRGTVSAYSGWISYPTTSLMRMPNKIDGIPGIARTLKEEGYTTDYLYGGDIDVMGKKGYLIGNGYVNLISDKDFSYSEAHDSKWGVPDSASAMRCFHMIAEKPAAEGSWHYAYQTINSHEPWEVPYNRFEDKILNAFAYTDHCIGQLIDSLKTLPHWDNMLVVLIPDHGITYQMTYENPNFFHSPMLWLGGAIREPRRISTLMGQNDLAATLLSQMGISHRQYPWSRNVLSKNYTHPFVYCTFPSGIMLKDTFGVSIYDITADRVILDTSDNSENSPRIQQAKSILQTSYDLLDEI